MRKSVQVGIGYGFGVAIIPCALLGLLMGDLLFPMLIFGIVTGAVLTSIQALPPVRLLLLHASGGGVAGLLAHAGYRLIS